MPLADTFAVATSWRGRNQRRAHGVDVLMRVKGRLAALDTPILVYDLSRTGFAVVSSIAFPTGETLDFRLVGEDGAAVNVTAQAVHTRPVPDTNLHRTGFMFVPGRLTSVVPQVLID